MLVLKQDLKHKLAMVSQIQANQESKRSSDIENMDTHRLIQAAPNIHESLKQSFDFH